MRFFPINSVAGVLLTALSLPALSSEHLSIEIYDGDNQTAAPGHTVPIDPAVRVTDDFGLPVSGESVTFSIESGGGLISGSNPTSDSQGVATVGSWALGTQPGIKELRATLDSDTSQTVVFTAIAEGETDLRVNLELEGQITAGEPFLYLLTITNEGPYTANGIEVTMGYDPAIKPESIAWICEPGGGSSDCGSDGVGPLLDYADIPPLGEVVYTVSSEVPVNLVDGDVTSSASIDPPVGILLTDPSAGSDSATGQISPNTAPIFQDRFEAGDG